MRFPADLIDEVRKRNDIVDVISEYVTLKRAGKNYKALCPFHSEKTPSFIVSPDKQIFHCFGCGAGGDVIGFIMRIEKTSFHDAVLRLAERAGISLRDLDPSSLTREARERERVYRLNEIAASFYESALWSEDGSDALSYLRKRGVELSTIKLFKIGYSPPMGDALTNFMVNKGFYPEELSRAGLATVYLDGRCYDKFRGRIIFPICDERGRILGFGGRSLGDEEPKYLNSPETIVFSKKRVLFGIDKALPFAKEMDSLVLVEGYMDMIKLYQAGIRNVVASLGTSLTEAQVNLIARHVSNVFIAYDADSAGESATVRGVSLLVNKGLKVKVLDMPPGMDPDDFVSKYGKDAFNSCIENARSFWDFRLDIILRDYDSSSVESKRETLRKGIDFLLELSEVDRFLVIPKLSEKLGVSESLIERALMSRLKGAKKGSSIPRSPLKDGFRRAEEDAITVLINHPNLKDKLVEYGGLELFEDEKIKWVAERILEGYSEYKIMEEVEEKGGDYSSLVSYLILRELPCDEEKISLYFEELLKTLSSRKVKRRIDELEEKLRKEGSLPPSLYNEYLNLLRELRRGRCFENDR